MEPTSHIAPCRRRGAGITQGECDDSAHEPTLTIFSDEFWQPMATRPWLRLIYELFNQSYVDIL